MPSNQSYRQQNKGNNGFSIKLFDNTKFNTLVCLRSSDNFDKKTIHKMLAINNILIEPNVVLLAFEESALFVRLLY